jgi:two-component system cell cycle sensor histidine kinase/response regulator CckA
MTADTDSDLQPPPMTAHEPARRSGSIVLVLLVAGAIVAAAVAFMTLGRAQAQPYILGLLALLAMVGLFNLFAFAAGIIRFADRIADDPIMRPIADHAFDGLAVTDSRGHVVYSNAAYLALTGAATAQDARPVERVFIGNPDVSEAVFRLLKAAREGKRQQEEVRVAGNEGAHGRWLRMRVRPLGQSKREAKYAVWTIADITRDRERQEDVFQELQHAIEYLDHAPCGFFSVNAAGSLVYVNATLANWLDYDLAEIGNGGLKLTDIVSGDGASLLTSIVPMPGEVKTEVFDIDLRMRGGKTMPVRLYHKLAFGADGAPGASRTLVISRARDERLDPQRAAEVRFMRFFDHTPMAIATVDRSGAVVRANARFAKLAQSLNSGGAAGKSILSVVNDRDRGHLIAAINQAAEGQGDIAPVEAMLDGAKETAKERWGQFFVTAVEEDERETEAAIVYMLETTERRTLENQINQSQKMDMVGQLAGGIAHDFNNVLSAIMMANDFLLNAHKPTDPSFQDIMQIKQNATRAATLVRQLLAFSRRQTLRPQVLDLGDALSDLTMLLRRLIGERVKLDLVHGRDLWPVKVDVSQFEQVIVNLAVNARDAMPDGGKLTVRTVNVAAQEAEKLSYKGMPAADYVRIDVTDTGTGIPCDIVDKIFEPFFSTKEVGKGTGLGLSTVYGIVKQTGGFVYVDSEDGEGTSFRIFLPRHHPEQELQPDAAGGAGKEPAEAKRAADLTGQGTILLVEDEDGLRSLNARGLRSRGYSVIEASNGIEAMEALEQKNGAVDLVVSDVVMPEMDGPTLLKAMRERNPDLKIIFVSGYAEDAFDKSVLRDDEQFAFLPKPFALSALVEKVKQTMAPS